MAESSVWFALGVAWRTSTRGQKWLAAAIVIVPLVSVMLYVEIRIASVRPSPGERYNDLAAQKQVAKKAWGDLANEEILAKQIADHERVGDVRRGMSYYEARLRQIDDEQRSLFPFLADLDTKK